MEIYTWETDPLFEFENKSVNELQEFKNLPQSNDS